MALTVQKTDTLPATEHQLALVAEHDTLKDLAAEVKRDIERVENEIVHSLPEGVTHLTKPSGRPLATLSPVKASGKFDMERFKADHPDLYKAYFIPGVGYTDKPRLTITH